MKFCEFTCELIGVGTTKAGITAALSVPFPNDRFTHFAPVEGRDYSIRLITIVGGSELAALPAPMSVAGIAAHLVNLTEARFTKAPTSNSQKGWTLLLTKHDGHRAVLALATWIN